jgi:hypothetical protein
MDDALAWADTLVLPWSLTREHAFVVEAAGADAATRALALPAESAAWWWLTHACEGDAGEHRVQRLRAGLDLLVVHEPRHADTRSRRLGRAP